VESLNEAESSVGEIGRGAREAPRRSTRGLDAGLVDDNSAKSNSPEAQFHREPQRHLKHKGIDEPVTDGSKPYDRRMGQHQ